MRILDKSGRRSSFPNITYPGDDDDGGRGDDDNDAGDDDDDVVVGYDDDDVGCDDDYGDDSKVLLSTIIEMRASKPGSLEREKSTVGILEARSIPAHEICYCWQGERFINLQYSFRMLRFVAWLADHLTPS